MFAHLHQSLEHKGSLFGPLSLDYIKALQAVYAHPAHLDALDPRDWEGLIRMAFTAVYGEDLEQFGVGQFTEAEAEGEDWILATQEANGSTTTPRARSKGKERMSEDMEVDEIEDDPSEDESQLATQIQKVSAPDHQSGTQVREPTDLTCLLMTSTEAETRPDARAARIATGCVVFPASLDSSLWIELSTTRSAPTAIQDDVARTSRSRLARPHAASVASRVPLTGCGPRSPVQR